VIRASWETVNVFFTEPELFTGKEVVLVDKSQSGGNDAFE
jgi:hypothetical protein